MHRISRRDFVRSTVLCGIGTTFVSGMSKVRQASQKSTRYIATYDTESPACLAACRKIVEVHKRYNMPATAGMKIS